MKKWIIGFCIIVVAACKQVPDKPNNKSKKDSVSQKSNTDSEGISQSLIIPGKQMGQWQLNENSDAAIDNLGKPDYSDAAMGKALLKWKNVRGGSLVMFVAQKMGVEDFHRLKMIRSSSSKFKTKNGFGVGSDWLALQAEFNLEKRGIFHGNHQKRILWVDKKRHIGFEMDTRKTCQAVVIYVDDYTPENLYIPLYDDFKKIEKQ